MLAEQLESGGALAPKGRSGSKAAEAGAEAEAEAEPEAEESRPPSQRSPTDEMSEAEIAEAAALDEEFKKEARERKEQYAATTKVRGVGVASRRRTGHGARSAGA